MPRLCPCSIQRPQFHPFYFTMLLLTVSSVLIMVTFHRWVLASYAPLPISSNLASRASSPGVFVHNASKAILLPNPQIRTRSASGSVRTLQMLMDETPFRFDPSVFLEDASRTYRISRDVLLPDPELARDSVVCLATQGSVERLHWLKLLADLWDAPVSVAVFVFSRVELDIVKVYLPLLSSCSDGIRRNFKFHLVYPKGVNLSKASRPPPAWSRILKGKIACSKHAAVLDNLLQPIKKRILKIRQKVLYPQNHLRNVARDGCEPDYHFLTDIDVMPKPKLAPALDVFLRNRPRCKCVYVVPVYETAMGDRVPRSKSQLLRMVRKKQARPYHQKVYSRNQHATNHRKWERLSASKPLSAAYRIPKYTLFYEPFYVASKEVPRYDERFIGYGFTRSTQVYETFLAGYQFWVLNNAFAIHQGMETCRGGRGQGCLLDAWRKKQNRRNWKRFLLFKNEMMKKYSVPTTCPSRAIPPEESGKLQHVHNGFANEQWV